MAQFWSWTHDNHLHQRSDFVHISTSSQSFSLLIFSSSSKPYASFCFLRMSWTRCVHNGNCWWFHCTDCASGPRNPGSYPSLIPCIDIDSISAGKGWSKMESSLAPSRWFPHDQRTQFYLRHSSESIREFQTSKIVSNDQKCDNTGEI